MKSEFFLNIPAGITLASIIAASTSTYQEDVAFKKKHPVIIDLMESPNSDACGTKVPDGAP